ncbi:phenylacetate--CoA ligase family protein [Aestuariirhabdus litorea]|uniref:Phenylacetate--CoA ligase family protein n=1 Tax=Aestuariirhabdus litorea TaxID=2528527 RepID=A0A3P3VRL2_9GAMM|nr:AMP-binding protein [Aestuariirhabdus litorea]RRJ83453.1 phenylacetate--CoA ligase family protein [Aestuariirhabdus litorea]RWW93615.1 phenylacetate--CoA ligase family protein [Endozoicomonadaceae bacterium GTF-13]
MSDFFDELETQGAELREQTLLKRLPEHLRWAQENTVWYSQQLAGINPHEINSREALATLPVLRKSELTELQRKHPPFAGMVATGTAKLNHIYQSPGPIYDPEGQRNDWWKVGRAFYAAGFRPGDRVQNCLSYHLTPGGAILDSGARACGCTVIPAGGGQTEAQVQVMHDLSVTGYCGTAAFLKLILDRADELGVDVSSLRKALFAGAALTQSLREYFDARGIAYYDAYASADLGLIAYQSSARQGLIVAEEILLEIVRPGSGDPLPVGEVGEVVVTSFNRDYPLIRFATGDLSVVLPGTSSCGRTNMRIRGWMGRADQTTKVKGMFVSPQQVNAVVARHPEIQKARLRVETCNDNDRMTLHCETSGLNEAAVVQSIRDLCKLSGEVEAVAPGSLPNDGIVIEDLRPVD